MRHFNTFIQVWIPVKNPKVVKSTINGWKILRSDVFVLIWAGFLATPGLCACKSCRL